MYKRQTVEGVCDFLYKDAASGAELSAFFREAAESNVGYFSDGKTLLVSMPVRLGAARLDALIFYILDASALDVAQFAAAGAYNAQFSIYAPDSRLLLSSAGANATVLENVADGARIRRIERAGQSQTAFLLENGGLYFAAIVPLDAMQQRDVYKRQRLHGVVRLGQRAGVGRGNLRGRIQRYPLRGLRRNPRDPCVHAHAQFRPRARA